MLAPGSANAMLLSTGNNIRYTITSHTTNFNLHAALGSPTAAVNVTVYIPYGVWVWSTTTGGYAFDEGLLPAGSEVTLMVDGVIAGKGGAGADATWGTWFPGIPGYSYDVYTGGFFPGNAGGHALLLRRPTKIGGSGYIAGGGGGGAGHSQNQYSCIGGGGGAGGGNGGYGVGGSVYPYPATICYGGGGATWPNNNGGVGQSQYEATGGSASWLAGGGGGGGGMWIGGSGGVGTTNYPGVGGSAGGSGSGSGFGTAYGSPALGYPGSGGSGIGAGGISYTGDYYNYYWGAAGGGGWGAAGGAAYLFYPSTSVWALLVNGGAGGYAIVLNGQALTWLSGSTVTTMGTVGS